VVHDKGELFGSDSFLGGGITLSSAAALGLSVADKAIENKNSIGKFKLALSQTNRLMHLLRFRAKNFGSTSVSVTDLESQE